MATEHIVAQGECISSIAFQYGFFPGTIWDHPENSGLKATRKNPNILMPGDRVFVPDKRLKQVSGPTNKVHKFKCKNTPEKLKLQLILAGKPRAFEDYELEIDDLRFSGKLDADGRLEHSIPPNVMHGKLLLQQGKEVHQLKLGNLNPDNEISGIQGRLCNLGFYNGPMDGKMSDELEQAIQEYQFSKNMEPDGTLSPATIAAIKQDYGT